MAVNKDSTSFDIKEHPDENNSEVLMQSFYPDKLKILIGFQVYRQFKCQIAFPTMTHDFFGLCEQ